MYSKTYHHVHQIRARQKMFRFPPELHVSLFLILTSFFIGQKTLKKQSFSFTELKYDAHIRLGIHRLPQDLKIEKY